MSKFLPKFPLANFLKNGNEPFPVEDETELEAGVASLADPSVDEDSDVLSGDGEDGFGERGRRYEHGAPLIGLALLLRRLQRQRQLLVEHLQIPITNKFPNISLRSSAFDSQ